MANDGSKVNRGPVIFHRALAVIRLLAAERHHVIGAGVQLIHFQRGGARFFGLGQIAAIGQQNARSTCTSGLA